MTFFARYYDGSSAHATSVVCNVDDRTAPACLEICDVSGQIELARWPVASLKVLPARRDQLRLLSDALSGSARLVITDVESMRRARASLPNLANRLRADRRKQIRIIGAATLGLALVGAGYFFGVPLLARQIVTLIPPAWEIRIGNTVAEQMEAQMGEDGPVEICDEDPQSIANLAISRFANATIADRDLSFTLNVKVVRSDIPNAFALPGGRAYYFSELLVNTETADEFAGVLAHEIGHVVHRHGMEQLVASAGTGLLLGFMLGDMTGLSIAGGLGAAIIDSRNSREAEREADIFSKQASQRLGYNPAALGTLLERVASDDEFTAALALLSSHPLTTERKLALESEATLVPTGQHAFTTAEWRAISMMCDQPDAAGNSDTSNAPDTLH